MNRKTELYCKHLSDLVKFPTVSYENSEKMDFDVFYEQQKYLEKTFPLVHKTLEKQVIGKAGLLYKWCGTGKSDKLPLILTAHQDVVSPGVESAWKFPPFSGTIYDDMIWGRGTTDCKCNIQAYFDAFEQLIEDGYTPDCDVYIGLGYNEEIVGNSEPSARLIANKLKEDGVQLGCLLDEGGGIEKNKNGDKYAFVYVAEKGFANFKFTKRDSGGHSSIPGPSTALGSICKVGSCLEDNPLDARLIPMVAQQLEASAPYMERRDISALCDDVKGNWEKLKPLLESDRVYNALIRTTVAVTMANGSAQPNVLPEVASLEVNCRLLPGDTIEDLKKHFESILPEDIEIELTCGTNPPAVQTTESYAYKTLEKTLKELHNDIPVIPCMLYGGTDSRYYVELSPTKSIYRFTCLQYDDRWAGLWHKTDERIPCDILSDNVEFYYQMIKNYCTA